MPAHAKDLTGQSFGRLSVLYATADRDSDKSIMWLCKCACGNTVLASGVLLRKGAVKSCGCLRREVLAEKSRTHGLRHHPLYQVWADMKQRCLNQNSPVYMNYGGRGISVSEEWQSDFESFFNWAIKHGYKKGLELDRENNNLGYGPDNCRFVSKRVNCQNRRNNVIVNYHGDNMPLVEACRKAGKDYQAVWRHINKGGMRASEALSK